MSILRFAVFSLALIGLAGSAGAFDLTEYDPWYYQSNEQGYSFTVPDKAQHFYGSAFLSAAGKRLKIPGHRVSAPLMAITAGFVYEVYQGEDGIGFSYRDFVADVLGVAALEMSSDSMKMWLDYSTRERVIMLNFSFPLGD